MNHSTLEIFIQVAETQSVTQAAKRLGRAQSNITTRIQQLEEELAVELFVRGNKKMVLSPAGVQFLSYARRILSLAEEAKQALHPTTPGGSLRLGAMEATAASRLPPLLTTTVPAGGYHPYHPTDPPVNRGSVNRRPRCRAGLPAAWGRWSTGLSRRAGMHPGVL